MRRHRFVIVVGFLMATLAPARAYAWGIEWLDKLSGPGPFVGFKVDVRALCWLTPQPSAAGSSPVAPLWNPACLRDGFDEAGSADVDRMRSYVSLEAVWSSSAKNEMFGSLQFDPRAEMDLFAFRPALMFRAFRSVDAGLAIGVNRFSGPALTEDVTWISVQPRVVIAPFANSRSRVARATEFRADVVFIPASARDDVVARVRQDLPGRTGSFEGGELRMMFGVEVDVFRLF